MTVANKERYQFKARGRGSRKKYGNSYDLPIEHSEKDSSLSSNLKDQVAYMEHLERARSKSARHINRLLREK